MLLNVLILSAVYKRWQPCSLAFIYFCFHVILKLTNGQSYSLFIDPSRAGAKKKKKETRGFELARTQGGGVWVKKTQSVLLVLGEKETLCTDNYKIGPQSVGFSLFCYEWKSLNDLTFFIFLSMVSPFYLFLFLLFPQFHHPLSPSHRRYTFRPPSLLFYRVTTQDFQRHLFTGPSLTLVYPQISHKESPYLYPLMLTVNHSSKF